MGTAEGGKSGIVKEEREKGAKLLPDWAKVPILLNLLLNINIIFLDFN